MVKNLPSMRETWVQSLGWEDPLENGTSTHSSMENSSLENSMNYIVHGVAKSWTRLSLHTKDRTCTPCTGRAVSYPLNYQGNEFLLSQQTGSKDLAEQRIDPFCNLEVTSQRGLWHLPRTRCSYIPLTLQKKCKRNLRVALTSQHNVESFYSEIRIFNSLEMPSLSEGEQRSKH